MSGPASAVRTANVGLDVILHNTVSYPELAAAELRAWLQDLLAVLAPDGGGLGVRFIGDRAMRAMNRSHRDSDATTDVLSFPGSAADGTAPAYIGDIAICVAQARRQAGAQGHDLACEIRILLLHGILHCLGWDHESDQGEMEAFERRLHRDWLER